jgi:hypothetical protein
MDYIAKNKEKNKVKTPIDKVKGTLITEDAEKIIDKTVKANNELTYDEVKEGINDYDIAKYIIKRKIDKYNEINLMKKEERKNHLMHYNLFNNYFENGMITPSKKKRYYIKNKTRCN